MHEESGDQTYKGKMRSSMRPSLPGGAPTSGGEGRAAPSSKICIVFRPPLPTTSTCRESGEKDIKPQYGMFIPPPGHSFPSTATCQRKLFWTIVATCLESGENMIGLPRPR